MRIRTRRLVVEERLRGPGPSGHGAVGKGQGTEGPTLLERFQIGGDSAENGEIAEEKDAQPQRGNPRSAAGKDLCELAQVTGF